MSVFHWDQNIAQSIATELSGCVWRGGGCKILHKASFLASI